MIWSLKINVFIIGSKKRNCVIFLTFKVGVVDGNVLRVLSRLRGIGAPIDNQKVVDHMWKLADDIVDKGNELLLDLIL